MEKKWDTKEEKDLYFQKRKKYTKWIVIGYVFFIFVFVGAIIYSIFSILENTSKKFIGTWNCNQGQAVLRIDSKTLKFYENDNNNLSSNYFVNQYNSHFNNQTKQEIWHISMKDGNDDISAIITMNDNDISKLQFQLQTKSYICVQMNENI